MHLLGMLFSTVGFVLRLIKVGMSVVSHMQFRMR